jgi:hypothetical protein
MSGCRVAKSHWSISIRIVKEMTCFLRILIGFRMSESKREIEENFLTYIHIAERTGQMEWFDEDCGISRSSADFLTFTFGNSQNLHLVSGMHENSLCEQNAVIVRI